MKKSMLHKSSSTLRLIRQTHQHQHRKRMMASIPISASAATSNVLNLPQYPSSSALSSSKLSSSRLRCNAMNPISSTCFSTMVDHDNESKLSEEEILQDDCTISSDLLADVSLESNESSSLLSLLSDDNDIFGDDVDVGENSDDDSDDSSMSSNNSISSIFDIDTSTDADSDTPSNPTSISSSSPKPKKKKKRKKRMKPPPKANLIPKVPTQQSKANAELLFDYIAPHVDEETIRDLLTKMKEFESLMDQELNTKHQKTKSRKNSKKKGKKKIMEYQTIIGRVDAFFSMSENNNGKKKKLKKKQQADDKYLAKHAWIKSLIAQFFAGATQDSQPNSALSSSDSDHDENNDDVKTSKVNENAPVPLSMDLLWRNPTFTPNINRTKRKEAISILMLAREMSLESPLLWNSKQKRRYQKHKKKKKKRSKDEEYERLEELKREAHFEKSAKLLEEEAATIASILAFRIPQKAHDELLDLFKGYAESVSETLGEKNGDSDDDSEDDGDNNNDHDDSSVEEEDGQPKEHVEIMKMLYWNLNKRVGFHVHFVAAELAEFFYVELPDQMKSEGSSVDAPQMPQEPLGRSDSRINESWNTWNELRDEVVDTFLSSQHMYVRLQSAIKKGDLDKKEKKKKSKAIDIDEEEVENIMIKYSNDAHKRAEELLEELDRLRINADGEMVGRSPISVQKPGRAPKGVNLQFECLMLNDNFGPYSNADTAFLADLEDPNHKIFDDISPEIVEKLPSTNRSIFVDNLPIDVTRQELEYLYSRCGEVESIEIFNLRPELDPGELSRTAILKRKKKNRMSGKKGATQLKNQRSPVYAIIKFEDVDGYQRATMDMLRIFGMVIRRQAVKSIPARDIHQLYIEEISEGYFAMDLEEMLSKALNPDMYISLNISQHINSQPKSCEITFPTYEVAHHAYQELKKLDFGDENINMHWMRTPSNALAYWTRDIVPIR